MSIGRYQLGRRLTSRHTNNIPLSAPFNNIGKHHGGDDELGSGIDGPFGVGGVHDGTAPYHDVIVVLLAKDGEMIEAVGGG